MRPIAFIAVIATVAVACAVPADSAAPSASSMAVESPTPTASSTPSVSATPSPASETPAPSSSPPPTDVPTPPPDLALTAVEVRDHIRVELELQRNPLPAGEPSWINVRVTNEGQTDATWSHDGCADPVSVHAVSQVAWPMGEGHQEHVESFKTYALGGHIRKAPDPHAWLAFVREERIHTGPPGCPDIGISETIEPGETISATRWWSGFSDPNRALPLAGPATIHGQAAFYWRGEEPVDIISHAIDLELDAWIVGDAAAQRLSPAQAVDAALADPDFAAYLETQDIASGRAQIVWYDRDHDRWEIGVMPWYETEPPRIHGVLVDAVTGEVIGPLDRPWDQDVEPFPAT